MCSSDLKRKVYPTSIRFTHTKISSINFLRTTAYIFSISNFKKYVTLHTAFQSDYPKSVKAIVRPHYLQKHLPIFQPTGSSHAQTEALYPSPRRLSTQFNISIIYQQRRPRSPTAPNLTRWAKAFTKPRIGIGPSGTISKRTLCLSMAAQVLLRMRSRVFSGCVSFHALTSWRKS